MNDEALYSAAFEQLVAGAAIDHVCGRASAIPLGRLALAAASAVRDVLQARGRCC